MIDTNSQQIDSMGAFNQGKNAARKGLPVESNQFDKGDPRYHQWNEGFRSWRCKETFDIFEIAE